MQRLKAPESSVKQLTTLGYDNGQQGERNKPFARLLMSEYRGRNALSEVVLVNDEPLVGDERSRRTRFVSYSAPVSAPSLVRPIVLHGKSTGPVEITWSISVY
jgi:hypothetical protein